MVNGEIEICAIAELTYADDLPFCFEDAEVGAIKGDTLRFLLRLELEENGTHFQTSERSWIAIDVATTSYTIQRSNVTARLPAPTKVRGGTL